ncbi:MAG TPA: hypothetical protein VH231_03365 [Solirubrobacteraceae bacterium]|nr:hypothetical protein [Solirubrobacteraceae bacterium]
MPGLLAVEEGLIQPEQVIEHAAAQVGDDGDVDACGHPRGGHRHAGAEHGDERDSARDQVDPVLVAVLDRGHRAAREQRRGDAVDHTEHGEDREPDQLPPVGPEEREEQRAGSHRLVGVAAHDLGQLGRLAGVAQALAQARVLGGVAHDEVGRG